MSDLELASMARDELVFYYQLTLGPAHIVRVRALDQQDGIRCRGVALAAREQTRKYDAASPSDVEIEEVTSGVYEEMRTGAVLRAARRHVLAKNPSVIIIDSPADSVQYRLGRWAQRRGILVFTRWAATRLDHPRFRWKEFLKGFIYRGWDGYLVTGARAADYLDSFGVSSDRMFFCGNPVDVDAIEASSRENAVSRRSTDLLFVGRFLRLKNLVPFLRAFSRYRREGGALGLRLAGFGETEAEVRSLTATIPGAELLGHLQFSDLVREYLSCAALVLPSYSENWGLVVNEAMHAGAPVLASTHVGCVPELVHEGKTGLLFDPMSESSMVDVLHRFEALSHGDREAMSRACCSEMMGQTPEAWAGGVAGGIRQVRKRSLMTRATSRPEASSQ